VEMIDVINVIIVGIVVVFMVYNFFNKILDRNKADRIVQPVMFNCDMNCSGCSCNNNESEIMEKNN